MKRSFFPVLLALAIMATSCIKNDESEGVKSMRMSQASLLTAMAGATTTAATADAALKTAQAALTTAQAAIQKAESDAKIAQMAINNAATTEQTRHNAAVNALNESLQAANDARTKATLTNQIAQEAAQSAYNLKMTANQQTMLDAQIASDKLRNDAQILSAKLALDQAQKAYDLGVQQNAQNYANNLAQLKTQVTTDLLNGYNNAYSKWNQENSTINALNYNIVYLGMTLTNTMISDSGNVNFQKKQLEGQKVYIDTLNARLVKAKTLATANTGAAALIANYTAEKKTLEAAQIALNYNRNVEYTDYRNASQAYSDASNLLYGPGGAQVKEDVARQNVLTAESNQLAAKNAFEKTSGSYTIYTYDVVNGNFSSTQTTLYAGRSHSKNGFYVNTVSIKDAVAAEKGDTTTTAPTGVYLTLQDKADVVLAQDAENAAKAKIAEMQANYNTVYDIWVKAHNAYLTSKTQYDAAQKAYNAAWNKYYDYSSYNSQWNRNNNRINDLTNFISMLSSGSGQTVVDQLVAQIKYEQDMLDNYYTPNYKDALKSFNTQMPLNQVNYAGMQNNIDNLKASLANEKTKLALYKASLDEWVAKINAALPKN